MLTPRDLAHFASEFGVSDAQILRDHLISHVLRALPALEIPGLHFFGGTALCRTYLEGCRLSEDVDLLHADAPSAMAGIVERLPRLLRREFPGMAHRAGRAEGHGKAVYLITPDVPPLRLYAGALHIDRPSWQFAATPVSLRYSDLEASVVLSCPTKATFAAMKMEAYVDRHAARDLYDLAGMAGIGALDGESQAILRSATGVGFTPEEFARVPSGTAAAWEAELAHQVRRFMSAEECRAAVAASLDPLTHHGAFRQR